MNVVQTSRPAKLPSPNDPCWCGSGSKYKKCHRGDDAQARAPVAESKRVIKGTVSPVRPVPPEIPRPDYVTNGRIGPGLPSDPATRIDRIKRACRAVAEVLNETAAALRPGITTDEIDAICHAAYIKRGGYPSDLLYVGGPTPYPKSLCTSVNEVVLHGVPDSRPLEAGDIVNLDVTIFLDGVHGDCSATYAVGGKTDPESERLIRVTKECLMLGIEAAKPGRRIFEIGRAIEAHAKRHGYGVVREFCGHGIGEIFHTDPTVPHYYEPHADTIIREGMVFTIEPMLTMGSPNLAQWDDGWTVVTADGRRSAQFEHTLLVEKSGAVPLTIAG
ncbi:MAG: type I methionyl aminopeptidase [Myxococcaceae bacterium]